MNRAFRLLSNVILIIFLIIWSVIFQRWDYLPRMKASFMEGWNEAKADRIRKAVGKMYGETE